MGRAARPEQRKLRKREPPPFARPYGIPLRKWGGSFFVRQLLLFICCAPAYADSSIPPYSATIEDRFCLPYLCPQGRPAFPKMAACFAERSYYTRERSIEIPLRPFILLFLSVFTMFFAKKALQMNFKNILYNYKFNIFTQIVSYRFV